MESETRILIEELMFGEGFMDCYTLRGFHGHQGQRFFPESRGRNEIMDLMTRRVVSDQWIKKVEML